MDLVLVYMAAVAVAAGCIAVVLAAVDMVAAVAAAGYKLAAVAGMSVDMVAVAPLEAAGCNLAAVGCIDPLQDYRLVVAAADSLLDCMAAAGCIDWFDCCLRFHSNLAAGPHLY